MISKYRLFILIFIPAALALLAAGMALIQQKNSEQSAAQFEDQLKNQWRLAAMIAENQRSQKALAELNEKYGLRVTLIAPGGEVLFDSAASGHLESHKDREEIRNAFYGLPSMAVRYSRTTKTHTIYYAEKLDDGRVLRVAYPASYYDAQKGSVVNQAMTGLIVLMALVALFAFLISRRMSRVLSSLSLAVKEAQEGGRDLPGFDNDDLDHALFSLSAATRELKLYSEDNVNLRQRLEYILANIDEGVLLLRDEKVLYHNRRVEEILKFSIPENLTEIANQTMLDTFASLTSGQTGELRLDDRTVIVSRTTSESNRLIMLHDVSDREKYSSYKSDLVGNISHELKTPLTLIMAAAEVIVGDARMPRPFLDKCLSTIYRNTRRINLLLDNLIFLHQLEGTKETDPDETDLGELVDDLKELLGQTTKDISYAFDPGQVKIHATHLISILTNLISNASKYSQGERIEVEMRKAGGALEITVSDQGPLIAAAERERIFERFYSLSKSRNREKSGSGLGLSIVKHIARLYKGRVTAEANEAGGNRFVVRLVEK